MSVTTAAVASPAAEARAAAWLKAWDSQGLHRTGTAGDAAGADWLAREAAALGGIVTVESFHLDRIDATAAYVEIDGEKIFGEPLFDAPDTPPEGIRATASETAGENQVAVRLLSPAAVYAPDFARQRREYPHAAEVIVTMGAAPGLAPLNAESFRRPFGSPTLQVSSVERDRLLAAVARKAQFRVVVRTTRTPAEARNVVVVIPGRDRTRPPVVVMTPRSSWWQSTAERGGDWCAGSKCCAPCRRRRRPVT